MARPLLVAVDRFRTPLQTREHDRRYALAKAWV